MNDSTIPLLRVAAVVLVLVALLSGCSEGVAEKPQPIRSVKLVTAGAAEGGGNRSYAGVVQARQRGVLSFEVPGRVADILVDGGATVSRGQVLARLDPAPLRLRRQKAEADLAAAKATAAERRQAMEKQRELLAGEVISPVAFEAAKAGWIAAESQVKAAEAAVALADRELAGAVISAPYAGRVVRREVQPFSDVTAGQPILVVDGSEGLELVATLPEPLAGRVKPGQQLQVSAPDGSESGARVSRVGPRSESGGGVPVVVELPGKHGWRVGSTVTVTLVGAGAPTDRQTAGVAVPLTAVVHDAAPGTGKVFVYNPATSRVKAQSVQLAPGQLGGEQIWVQTGLLGGERVVAAGAAFLQDGQIVKPFIGDGA